MAELDRPVTLDQFGDVLTDRDLARLMRRSDAWPRQERWQAKRRGLAPNLPAAIPDNGWCVRYRKDAVIYWMQTGRRTTRQRAS